MAERNPAECVAGILIACIDNLTGFEEAIVTMYPRREVQSCLVHQVCNTYKYIATKDSKAAMADIRKGHKAANREEGDSAVGCF